MICWHIKCIHVPSKSAEPETEGQNQENSSSVSGFCPDCSGEKEKYSVILPAYRARHFLDESAQTYSAMLAHMMPFKKETGQ